MVNLSISKTIKENDHLNYNLIPKHIVIEYILNTTEIIPLLLINGIKFSSKLFQIDVILPQTMIITSSVNLENKCLIKNNLNSLEKNNKNNKNTLKKLNTDNNNTYRYIDNQDNKVIEGNPDRIKIVTDHWKFTKNILNKSPNWYLTEITNK